MTAVDLVRGVRRRLACRQGVAGFGKAYRAIANENRARGQGARGFIVCLSRFSWFQLCGLGFELDESNGHVVSICAIDNLMKGASGSAVQCMNLMMGWDETMGLEFAGLHPIT